MIFIDTSALYSLADQSDHNHQKAREIFARALKAGEEFLVHNYVLVESAALIQHRLGAAPAKKFLEDAARFSVVWVDAPLHAKSVDYFSARATRNLSFVDCVSFVLMRQKGIRNAFVFDEDFAKEGFSSLA